MNNKLGKKIALIYHQDCADGFSGAWVAWKKFGRRADYLPMFYENSWPKNIAGRDIYMVDFSFPVVKLKEIKKINKKVVVIDHHETGEESFKASDGGLFSQKHSGAVLAWQYFFPKKKMPKFLEHVEDQDLWKFKKKNTREIMAYARVVNHDFKSWDKLIKYFEYPEKRKEFIKIGRIILKYEDDLAEEIISSGAEEVLFQGKKILAVNSPVLTSLIGNMLYKRKPPFAAVWSRKEGRTKISLRSNGKIDMAKIARELSLGGGGHPGAAGFTIPDGQPLPWKTIDIANR